MAIETITIFRADTGEAVKTLGDLKESIKALKERLNEAEVGTKDYADTLTQLQTQQAALKNAMHDTTYETDAEADAFAATAKQAKGLGDSYNALVRRMADLDQQFRSTEDTVKRAQLGREIKDINQRLKDMDAQRGKFGRNVGDYFNAIQKGLKGTNATLGLIGKQPIIGMVGLLASVISKIGAGLKENETALDSIHRLGKALEPVAQFFEGVLQKIADLISRAVDFVLELGQNSGIQFNKIIGYATGVGNAVLQFILTPVRQTIEAVKGLGSAFKNLFKGDVKGAIAAAKEAGDNIADAFKKGFSFKENFKSGQQVGEEFVAGLASTKKKAQDTAKDIKKAVLREFTDLTVQRDKLALQAIATSNKVAQIVGHNIDEIMAKNREEYEQAKALQAARIEAAFGYAAALSNILGSVADLYEQNGEEDEKSARKAKALRTASAIIASISGAISAYMNTIESIKIPQVAIPLAAVNAATVLAAGMAQVKQINAVKVGSSGSSSGAVVSAPAFDSSVPQVRTVTGASEEDRLNRMASPARVYILASDLQAERESSRVRVAETSW